MLTYIYFLTHDVFPYFSKDVKIISNERTKTFAWQQTLVERFFVLKIIYCAASWFMIAIFLK